VASRTAVTTAPEIGCPVLFVTNPEMPDVVTPWANIVVVTEKARATAPAKVHLRDGNVDFIGLLGLNSDELRPPR
jgi:hypothetical protein